VFRALEGRRPFDDSGMGFRDTVIWKTILEECNHHGERIIFITNDSDFGSPLPGLNGIISPLPDLIEDMVKAGYSKDRLEIYRGIKQFNNNYALPMLGKIYRFNDPIEGTIAAKIDALKILESNAANISTYLSEDLPIYLNVNSAKISKLSYIRWPENVRIIEAVQHE